MNRHLRYCPGMGNVGPVLTGLLYRPITNRPYDSAN